MFHPLGADGLEPVDVLLLPGDSPGEVELFVFGLSQRVVGVLELSSQGEGLVCVIASTSGGQSHQHGNGGVQCDRAYHLD